MKIYDLYTGVAVIEEMIDLNLLFKERELVLTDQLRTQLIKLYPNMCLVLKSGKQSGLVIVKDNKLKLVDDNIKLSDISPRNKEQRFLMSLLKDKDIDLITISGKAGSGKTLLSLAYAWEQLKSGAVNKIVLCKSLSPVGREIGFLKGDLLEKVTPWLGAFLDNFQVLGVPEYEIEELMNPEKRYQARKIEKIEVSPITFIQGRSISNAVIIIDEAQNLSREIVKQVLTRPAENTKIILLGDLDQIFEKGVTKESNGFKAVIDAGKESKFIGHIHLLKSERSRLTDWASDNL